MNTVLLAAVLCGQCSGGSCPAPVRQTDLGGWQARVVRIDNGSGHGTGTIVGVNGTGQALVLTAAHVVGRRQYVICQHESGRSYSGRVLGRADEGDLAAIEIGAPPGISELPITDIPSKRVWTAGYGTTGKLHIHYGQYLGAGIPEDEQRPDNEYEFQACPGDSGGPMVDEAGRLAGVVWGSSGTTTGSVRLKGARNIRITDGHRGNGSYGVSLVKLLDYTRTFTLTPFFIKCKVIQSNPPQSVTPAPPMPPPANVVPIPVTPAPAPVPVQPAVDLSGILADIAMLKGQVGQITASQASTASILQGVVTKLNQPITFSSSIPGAGTAQGYLGGAPVLLDPVWSPPPTTTTPAPPTPTPAK